MMKTSSSMKLASKTILRTEFGLFDFYVFVDPLSTDFMRNECVVLKAGDVQAKESVLVRVHDRCVTSEIFRSTHCDCRHQLEQAMERIQQEGGLIIYTYQEGRGIGLAKKIETYALRQTQGLNTYESHVHLNLPIDARRYEFVPAILQFFQVSSIRLLSNNPYKQQKLADLGLEIVEVIDINSEYHQVSIPYIREKATGMGHEGLGVFFHALDGSAESCFSSFFPVTVHLDGRAWPTAEHYYQAQKFDSQAMPALVQAIAKAPTAQAAAELAQKNKKYIRQNWQEQKLDVMQKVVLAKFMQSDHCREILLNTKDRPIYESSPADSYWGVGEYGSGQNHLGKILMAVRSLLRQQLVQK